MTITKLTRSVSFAALALLGAAAASAAVHVVRSINDLRTAIDAARPGDEIVVTDGSYVSDAPIAISCAGTAAKPIVIAAQTIGGVTLGGSDGFSFKSPAAYVAVQGFHFTHEHTIDIPAGTDHCRLTRNIIELKIPPHGQVSYVTISGDNVEIDHNELRNKSTLGQMLDVRGSGKQVARNLWVHHNYFHDFSKPGGNGAETLRLGLSGLSLSTGNAMVEYNLFVRCVGENEIISNKSCGNTYRYNTVLDSPGGEISQRHGNNCLYYGNYMRNTHGMRFYGDSHLIFSNYLVDNAIGITMGNGDGDVFAGSKLTSHDRPDNNVVVFNTLINNKIQYQMGGRKNGLGATNTVFANNIIVGGTTSVSISDTAPYTHPTWRGNIVWNTPDGGGDMPASGYSKVDPKLTSDANGIFHLEAGSPAINGAAGVYSDVKFDMDGQPRSDAEKDIGADEFSSAPVKARMLTPADVGPNADAAEALKVVLPASNG